MSKRSDAVALLVADVFEAAGAIRHAGDVVAGTVGQSQARWQVLSVLSEGDWTLATAADRLGITRQSVRRVVGLLADEGLVDFAPNPRHRGSPFVYLTGEGREILAAITTASHGWRTAVAAEIPADAIETTRTTLQTLARLSRETNTNSPSAADRPGNV
jgi:DNA-binding MarR family transcriptional regulator